MIKEIQAKVLLSHVKQPDTWFGLKYNMNLYRGCEHQCIYCDSRSLCYGIEKFTDVLVKVNAIELLEDELSHKRVIGTIGTGAMSDPYTPAEKTYNLTGQALEVIARFGFPVHIITKSDMVLKDLETLRDISRTQATVSFSITTTDDDLARRLEPGAPSPSDRLKAMTILAANGIQVGVTMMPILPFIEDNAANIANIIKKSKAAGASYIIPWMGMSLRDRQRAYYYDKLDRLFPGMRSQYVRQFGNQYSCSANDAEQLYGLFNELCAHYDLARTVKQYTPESPPEQMSLFE
jgi:DNA repair photolyase